MDIVALLLICRSALIVLLVSTILATLKDSKGNNKWYSIIFLILLFITDI